VVRSPEIVGGYDAAAIADLLRKRPSDVPDKFIQEENSRVFQLGDVVG
jgi:hypothetical protein